MTIPRKIVELVLERDEGRCVIAGPHCLGEATCADHRANRGSGGSKVLDDPRNLVAACALCNNLKEDADGAYRGELIRRGVRVAKSATNHQTLARCANKPVTYPDGKMFFLVIEYPYRTELAEPPF